MLVGTADMLTSAIELAEGLVAPLGRRWRHVEAVAERAGELASTVPAADRGVLVTAAWLHDVGYAPRLAKTRFHALDGARFLRDEGWPARLVNLVAHHSGARFEATERGLAAELAEFELEDSAVMDALLAADLTRGPIGEPVSYQQRVSEILQRYPPDNPVHRTWLAAAEPLEASVQRALWREAAGRA